ncbi:lipoprotein [Micromonosporaceae bacterium Da 78-11]
MAAVAAILLAAGCGDTGATPRPDGAASAPGTTKAAACTAATESFRELFKDILAGVIPSSGEPAGDSAAAARTALTAYAERSRQQAATTADPALRAVLERGAVAADETAKGADPTDLDTPGFQKSTAEIEQVCKDVLTPSTTPGAATVRVGAAGSACSLPVSFDLVARWKPSAVDLAGAGELADLYRNGPFSAVCEIDAKPAGNIGFLRVYTAPGRTGRVRGHLETFIAAEAPEARKAGNHEVSKVKYSDVVIGGEPAAEVTWETYNKTMEHASKYSAFALNTPSGAVVVQLSPFGADEHAKVLPAFQLAERTLVVNP